MRALKREPKARKGRAGAARQTARQRRRLTRVQRTGIIAAAGVLAVTLLAGGVYQFWRSGLPEAALTASEKFVDRQVANAGLTVQDVLVTGRAQASADAVLDALAVRRGQSILGFDPDRARERLLALEWIKEVRVERRLPNTIVVRLQEHQPLALWQNNGRLMLIDRDGESITGDRLGQFAHLPMVIGEDAPANAAELLDVLRQRPALFNQVEASIRVGQRRWNIRLKNGIDVNLPEDGAAVAWSKLAELVEVHGILERDIAAIDLRLPDRLVVRMTSDGAKKPRKGKDT